MSDSRVTGTILGAVGGASLATTMGTVAASSIGLGSAAAGAKTGALAGALAGPVGVAAGAAIGGVFGYASFYLARGISAMTSSDAEDSHSEQQEIQEKAGESPTSGKSPQEPDRGQEDGDREEEESSSEDEQEEESSEVSDYETQLEEVVARILRCHSNAPPSVRASLLQELVKAMSTLVNNPEHRVVIERGSRDLLVRVPGFRPVRLPRELRDILNLGEEDNLEQLLDLQQPSQDQPVVYRIQCRHCDAAYVGLVVPQLDSNRTGQPYDFQSRMANHRSNVDNRSLRLSLPMHLETHREGSDDELDFANSFEILVIRCFVRNTDKKVVRNWEVFYQWVFKGRGKDGGIGRR